MGTPVARAQQISILPQLDGPVSVPVRDPIRGRVLENTRFVGQEYSPRRHIYSRGLHITKKGISQGE